MKPRIQCALEPGFHGVPAGPDRAQIRLSRRAGPRRRRRRTHGAVRVATCCLAGWLRQSSAAGWSWPGRRVSPDRRARLEGDSAMLAKAVVQPLRDIRVTREPLLGAIADDRGCLVFDENELATATVSPAFMAASHAMASCSTSGDRSMHPPRPRQATFVDSRPETSAGAYQSRCWPPGGAVPAAFHGSMRLTPMPVKSEVLRVASVAFRTRQIAAI